jgi:hypothetical protein
MFPHCCSPLEGMFTLPTPGLEYSAMAVHLREICVL